MSKKIEESLEKVAGEAATALAGAFNRATDKKAVKEGRSIDEALTAIGVDPNFEVKEISEEELEASKRSAEETKHLAETLGRQELDIREALSRLKQSNPNWSLLRPNQPGYGIRVEIERLEVQLEKLKSLDGDFGERKEFAKFVDEIRRTNAKSRGAMLEMFDRLEKEEHFFAPWKEQDPKDPEKTETERIKDCLEAAKAENNGKLPFGTQFFERKPWFPPSEQTSRNRAVGAEVRKKVTEHEMSLVNLIQSGCESDLSKLQSGRYGVYYLYSPRVADKERGWTRGEGHLKLELSDRNKGKKGRDPFKIVEFKRGLGSLTWIADEGYRWIPLSWLNAGRMFVKKDAENPPSQEEIGHVNKKIRVVRAICIDWNNQQEVKKQKEAKKAEPVDKAEDKSEKTTPKKKASKKAEKATA